MQNMKTEIHCSNYFLLLLFILSNAGPGHRVLGQIPPCQNSVNVEKMNITENMPHRNKMNVDSIGLCDLTRTNDSLHFRFWTETQAVDIWTNDYIHFNGLLANYTTAVNEPKSKDGSSYSRWGKFYSSVAPIDTTMAREIYQMFTDNSVFEIPDDKKIKGWGGLRLDGYGYSIEYSTKTTYTYKDYWCPENFKEVREAVVISNMYDSLNQMLHMHETLKSFISWLPRGCYHYRGIQGICNISFIDQVIDRTFRRK